MEVATVRQDIAKYAQTARHSRDSGNTCIPALANWSSTVKLSTATNINMQYIALRIQGYLGMALDY